MEIHDLTPLFSFRHEATLFKKFRIIDDRKRVKSSTII